MGESRAWIVGAVDAVRKQRAVAAWEAGHRSWHCTTDHSPVPCGKCLACVADRAALEAEFENQERKPMIDRSDETEALRAEVERLTKERDEAHVTIRVLIFGAEPKSVKP